CVEPVACRRPRNCASAGSICRPSCDAAISLIRGQRQMAGARARCGRTVLAGCLLDRCGWRDLLCNPQSSAHAARKEEPTQEAPMKKRYTSMNARELANATREFD